MLNIILFLICPFYSFCYSIRRLKNRDDSVLVFISLFMALCAILSPPFADLANHARDYAGFKNSILTTDIIQTNGKDFILYTLSNIFAKLGVNFDIIRGIFVFICYQISFFLFRSILKERPDIFENKKLYFYVFLCFFLSVPFIWVVNGLRSATAAYLMVYACYFATKNNIIKTIIYAFLSVGTHFFLWIFVPFLIIPFTKIKINKRLYIPLFVLSIVAGRLFLGFIFDSATSDLNNMTGVTTQDSNLYLNQLNYSTASSINGLIAFFLERVPILLLVLYSIASKDIWANCKNQTIFYICILLFNLCLTYFVPLQRISWLILPIILYLFIKNIYNIHRVKMIVIALLLSQFSYVYGYREVFFATPFYYLLLPAPVVFLHTYPLDFRLKF